MQLVGLRSILPLLPTLALACAAPSPGAPEQARDAPAPPSAVEQATAAPAPSEPLQAEPAKESQSSSTRAHDNAADVGPPGAAVPPPAPIGGEADRSQSRLDIAVPSINGGLNRDIIRRTASDHADDILDCHGRALASLPGLTGELTVELWLNERGRVTNAELTGDRVLTDRIGKCVIELAMGWTFPDAGGEGSFKLAFDFSGE